jgi:hypothetical protein
MCLAYRCVAATGRSVWFEGSCLHSRGTAGARSSAVFMATFGRTHATWAVRTGGDQGAAGLSACVLLYPVSGLCRRDLGQASVRGVMLQGTCGGMHATWDTKTGGSQGTAGLLACVLLLVSLLGLWRTRRRFAVHGWKVNSCVGGSAGCGGVLGIRCSWWQFYHDFPAPDHCALPSLLLLLLGPTS